MKKLILTLFLATASDFTFAQTINFGVKGGLNLSNQSLSGTNYPLNGKNLVGFHVGGILDIGFQDISIQPGILFSTKGFRQVVQLITANQQSVGSATFKTTLNYIELPVNLLYHIHVAPEIAIYLGGGPYLGYGLSGNVSGPNDSYKVKFGSGDSDYKNPDYGVNFIAEIELKKRLMIDAGYGLGLGNLTHAQGATLQNRVMSLSVGYLFR